MRITPVGLTVAAGAGLGDLTALVDAVQQASLVTHNTSVALAGAAAVAAAVSVGLSSMIAGGAARVALATDVAVAAAGLGAERGHWVAGADVAARIYWAADLVSGRSAAEAAEVIYSLVGTSLATQESVPGGLRRAQRRSRRPVAGVPAGRVARRGHATRSPRWQAPSPAPAMASPPSRRTRSRSSTPRASASPTWPIPSWNGANEYPER